MARPDLKPKERIILALDFSELRIAKFWVENLRRKIKTFKVGPILFLDAGPIGIKEFRDMGADVFLDLKFHDIPSTVEHSGRQAVRYGVKMFTVHALGGFEMMKAVSDAVSDESGKSNKRKPLVLAVTVLTSQDEASLKRIRPLLMSTATTIIGLMPIFLVQGRGSDVMQPMAIPSVGGMTVQLITLFIAPCIYCLVMEWQLERRLKAIPPEFT